MGELLRYALPEAAAGEPVLEAQGAKKSEGALARRCVVGCAWEKGRVRVCLLSLDLQTSHRNHRQWAARPFTLAPTLTLKVERNGLF